jgi:hypothetical protein
MDEKDLYARKTSLLKKALAKADQLDAEDAKSASLILDPLLPSSKRQTVFLSADIPPNCCCGGVASEYSVTPPVAKAEREPVTSETFPPGK